MRRERSGRRVLERTTGGLVSALVPAVEAASGTWFAWNPGGTLDLEELTRSIKHELILIPISEDEVAGYYRGLSNGALWPLCHYAIDRCRFQKSDWEKYVAVNGRFAEGLANASPSDSLVWVHDYHLMLVPALLRARRTHRGTIAYFHHIPFPAPDVFRVLPWNREILRGLLGADLVGFHVETYATNFLEACRRLPDVDVDLDNRTIRSAGRTTRVGAFPIGIDSRDFSRLANDTEIRAQAKVIRRGIGVEKIMLGVDRLDYTKGIEQRMQAFDRLLERQPHLIGAVSLLQIAVPSRAAVPEYSAFKKRIDELVGRINGKHAQDGWQPIHCVYRSFSQRKLIAYYLAADVALVTPLRDGMNLIAKEFCASRADCDGVLVLSEFAGAAECMAEEALVVNPFDLERFAETIATALTMEREDRTERMRALRAIVNDYDIYDWMNDFVEHANGARDAVGRVEVVSSAG